MFQDQNPRASSNANDPWQDTVRSVRRPERFQDLLTDSDFATPGWSTYFASERFFYLDGVGAALRLFRSDSAAFLKSEGFIDQAIEEPEVVDDWSRQSGVELAVPVSLPRTREIKEAKPTHFQKCVVCIVAFELAIRKRLGNISPFWVYDYMRIKPAVYNIRKFNQEKLELLRKSYSSFDSRVLAAARQDHTDLLVDLANGKTVTLSTATNIKNFLDANCREDESHYVEEIRAFPGNRGLGRGPASSNEIF